MRGAPETSFEEVRIGVVDGRGKSSEMWGGETTQWTGEPNGPVGEVGLNELGPTNVEDMKHNENDITKQIEIAKNGDKKHAIGEVDNTWSVANGWLFINLAPK